jgi:transketolase
MSTSTDQIPQLANAIRALAMDAVEQAKSGHPGMPMGMADVATVLFARHMRFDPTQPNWPDRDRFILSAGHGSMLLYALLYLTGYPEMTIEEIRNFRQIGSKTPGHPEYGHTVGVETTTGPLGQGFANGVGMALAERNMNARFGDDLVEHFTYVIAGDGCLMEGISHEAASLAGHLGLGRMIVLFDDNGISIDGPTSLTVSDDQPARFKALGWHVISVDGHDPEAVDAAITEAKADPRPSLIACKTTIGFGAPKKAGTAGSHGAPLGAEEIAGTRAALGWTAEPFEIPKPILDAWRAVGKRGAETYEAWLGRFEDAEQAIRVEFDRVMSGKLDAEAISDALHALKAELASDPPKLATRVSSQNAIAAFAPAMPELIGGSADLTGSNNTKVGSLDILDRSNYGGQYVHYGVREHAMAAAMNGMALHGGVVPYGGTFLVFTDYCRPSIRLAALMGLRVIYVMTHDSIGLGEDGPTHQPVEHMAALRTIPNLHTMRPADAIEAAECWQMALERTDGPSVLALSRQGLPGVRTMHTGENRSARGGYILQEAKGERAVTLVATGSEVDIARRAKQLLEKEGVHAALVSMPCPEAFAAQDAAYRSQVITPNCPVVVVEAGIRQSWDRIIGDTGGFIGMSSFGASAPAGDLYMHFGITPDAVASEARRVIGAD